MIELGCQMRGYRLLIHIRDEILRLLANPGHAVDIERVARLKIPLLIREGPKPRAEHQAREQRKHARNFVVHDPTETDGVQ